MVTITVPCQSGVAADLSGLMQEVYTTAEDVYGVGSGFEGNKDVDIYILPCQMLSDCVAIDTLGILVGPVPVKTDANGEIGPVEIWPNPIPGHYLMIFDDSDGYLNAERDPADEFAAIAAPAVPLVTLGILALIGLLSIVAISRLVKKRRN